MNLKLSVVAKDFLEKNHNDIKLSREILNYGHTIGHAIEKANNIKHGFAVAIGIVKESKLTTNYYTLKCIEKCLLKYGLPINIDDNIYYLL